MTSIKLFDVELTVDGKAYTYEDNQWMDDIHIPENMKTDILRHLMCFHTVNLTEAYVGHTVVVKLVAPKDE